MTVMKILFASLLTSQALGDVKIVIDRAGKVTHRDGKVDRERIILNFAEVNAFDSNGELLKPFKAELNKAKKPAYKCIDDNLNTRCETKKHPNPKLTISYPDGADIAKIVVENRRDCCQKRADGAQIAVFQGEFETWSSTLEGALNTYVFDVTGEHETGNTEVTDLLENKPVDPPTNPEVTDLLDNKPVDPPTNPVHTPIFGVDPPTTELTPTESEELECDFTDSDQCDLADGCRWVGSDDTTGLCMVDDEDEQCDVDEIGPAVLEHMMASGNIHVMETCTEAGKLFRSGASPDGTLDVLRNPQRVAGLMEAVCPCLVELEDEFVRKLLDCKMGPVVALALYDACPGMP